MSEQNQNIFELTVDTGSVTVPVKNRSGQILGQFEFMPTDSNLVSRVEQVAEHFNSLKEVPELAELEQDVRDQMNFLFGTGTAESLFGMCGPLTVLENGDFYFESVLSGITSLIENVMKQRVQVRMRKIKALTKGYK